jgi:hypothetical protein
MYSVVMRYMFRPHTNDTSTQQDADICYCELSSLTKILLENHISASVNPLQWLKPSPRDCESI